MPIRSSRRPRRSSADSTRRFAFHLDQQTEKNRAGRHEPDEARRQALLEFGGVERRQGEHAGRDPPGAARRLGARRPSWPSRRCGGRLASRQRRCVTLALGIGATSAIFSVVRTVLLEPLPYREPDRIVAVWETNRGGTSRNVIAPANFVAWRERTPHTRASGHGGTRDRRHDRQRPACTRLRGSRSRPTSLRRWASSRCSAAPTRPRKISAARAASSC